MERLLKAASPSQRRPGASARPPFFGAEEAFGRAARAQPACQAGGPFVPLFHSPKTLIRSRECLFRTLKGRNRSDRKS